MPEPTMFAYCGLVCPECPAWLGTQRNDRALLEKTAAKWSTPDCQVRPEDLICDGCRTAGKRLAGFCYGCQVRLCGEKRGVQNCGHCDRFPCPTLEQHWQFMSVKEARVRLSEISRKRRGTPA